MLKIFVLSSGRSGTRYLTDLFKYNIKGCVSKHEPLPKMFGKPIYWYNEHRVDKIRKHFIWKKRRINSYRAHVYIETNNAFLKSFSDVAMEFFQDMKLIHLIRNPFEVARSELNKEILVHKTLAKIIYPLPKYYWGDDENKYYIWSLTKKEKIYQDVNLKFLTPYQNYLLQWIEIENRAMDFLKKYDKHRDCFKLFNPEDLNDIKKLSKMFRFFNLKLKSEFINTNVNKNVGLVPTIVSTEDKRQLQELINYLPERYLTIFKEKPYSEIKWSHILKKKVLKLSE